MTGPQFPVIDNPDEEITLTRRDAVNLAIAAERGEALTAWIAATALLGHTRPGNTLECTCQPRSRGHQTRSFVTSWRGPRVARVWRPVAPTASASGACKRRGSAWAEPPNPWD